MVKAVDREAEKAAKMAMRRLRAAGSGERDEQLSRRKEEKDTSQAETRNNRKQHWS